MAVWKKAENLDALCELKWAQALVAGLKNQGPVEAGCAWLGFFQASA